MSQPETNLKKQTRRHRGPLLGMALGGIFVVGLLVWYLFSLAAEGQQPAGADVQIDGRSGEPVIEGEPTLVEPEQQ